MKEGETVHQNCCKNCGSTTSKKESIQSKKTDNSDIQCAVCGEFFNSYLRSGVYIACPKCGTVRFVCD